MLINIVNEILRFTASILGTSLILTIYQRLPKSSAGLTGFATSFDGLNSTTSAEKILNYLMLFVIFIYLLLALILNQLE